MVIFFVHSTNQLFRMNGVFNVWRVLKCETKERNRCKCSMYLLTLSVICSVRVNYEQTGISPFHLSFFILKDWLWGRSAIFHLTIKIISFCLKNESRVKLLGYFSYKSTKIAFLKWGGGWRVKIWGYSYFWSQTIYI